MDIKLSQHNILLRKGAALTVLSSLYQIIAFYSNGQMEKAGVGKDMAKESLAVL